MICVVNTFPYEPQVISRHRTAKAAYLAEQRFQRAVRRNNGPDSYIPTAFWLEERGQQTAIDIYEALQVEGVDYEQL